MSWLEGNLDSMFMLLIAAFIGYTLILDDRIDSLAKENKIIKEYNLKLQKCCNK